jgi:hypothetical protein
MTFEAKRRVLWPGDPCFHSIAHDDAQRTIIRTNEPDLAAIC